MTVEFILNGAPVSVRSDHPHLLAALREELDVTSAKDGCSPQGQCGCCTVHLDGEAVKSCTMLAAQADGCAVTTIEGLMPAAPAIPADPRALGDLHPVQQAFAACHGLQCGFCTPGMIMAVADLLRRHPSPTRAQIDEGLAGNLCRCTGYVNIVVAVDTAAQLIRERP